MWLESLESSLSGVAVNEDLNCVSLLLSTIFVKCSETSAFRVLNVIAAVCKVDPTQVHRMTDLLFRLWVNETKLILVELSFTLIVHFFKLSTNYLVPSWGHEM